MTRTTHFEVVKQTKAGTVRGSLMLSLEGPPDGLAATDRELVAHLLSAPGDVVKPAVVESEPQGITTLTSARTGEHEWTATPVVMAMPPRRGKPRHYPLSDDGGDGQ